MKATLIFGPSGSGKTTKVNKILDSFCSCSDKYIEDRPAWVERDYIRFKVLGLCDWRQYKPDHKTEKIVDAYWKHALVEASLNERDVIISDTLCKENERNNVVDLLKGLGYTDIELIRMDISLEKCIERDSGRGVFSVGEKIIRRQWDNFVGKKEREQQ